MKEKTLFPPRFWGEKIILAIIFFLFVLFFSNDFGLIDIQKTAIILSAGIDKTEAGQFQVTAKIAVPQASKSGSDNKAVSVSGEGDTVAQAFQEINLKTGWFPKLIFCDLILLGENTVQEDVFNCLGYFLQNEYISDNCLLATCEGSAEQILNAKIPTETNPSFALQKILATEAKQAGNISTVNLKDFSVGYYSEHKSGLMPYIKLIEQKEQDSSSQGGQSSAATLQDGNVVRAVRRGERSDIYKDSSLTSQNGQYSSLTSQDGQHISPSSQDGQPSSLTSQGGQHISPSFQNGQYSAAMLQGRQQIPSTLQGEKRNLPRQITDAAVLPNGNATPVQGQSSSNSSQQSAQSGESQQIYDASQTAFFYAGKLAGILTREQSFALNLALNPIRQATLQVPWKEQVYALNLSDVNANIKFDVKENSPVLSVSLKAVARTSDCSAPRDIEEISQPNKINSEILKEGEQILKERLEEVFQICRTKKCDIFELLDKLQKFKPAYYRTYKDVILDRVVPSFSVKLSDAA